MKRIVVFSDTHGTAVPMQNVVAELNPDHVLFLGDGWNDTTELMWAFPQLPLIRVPGNCDYQPGEQIERLVELYGKRIYLCHGHMLGVKSGLDKLIVRGHRLRADIALYGHTHRGYCNIHDGMWVMNPGSLSRYERQSYGLITIEGEKCDCRICSYPD